MLLAYLDESYTKDRYWIAALVCPDRQVASLSAALDEVVAWARANYREIPKQAELHGRALVQGEDDWLSLASEHEMRVAIYEKAFEAIAAHDVAVVIRGVDIPRLNERYVRTRQMELVQHETLSGGSSTGQPRCTLRLHSCEAPTFYTEPFAGMLLGRESLVARRAVWARVSTWSFTPGRRS